MNDRKSTDVSLRWILVTLSQRFICIMTWITISIYGLMQNVSHLLILSLINDGLLHGTITICHMIMSVTCDHRHTYMQDLRNTMKQKVLLRVSNILQCTLIE